MKPKIELFLEKENLKIGKRLKEERVRLGFNQAEFAERLGIHKNTQMNYETGKRAPTAEYYEKASKLGMNIPHVINGETIVELPVKAGQLASLVFKKVTPVSFLKQWRRFFIFLLWKC